MTPIQELKERYKADIKKTTSSLIKLMLEMVLSDIKEMELLEKEQEVIINAFLSGRKAGAIFKRGKDNEGLAEQHYKSL